MNKLIYKGILLFLFATSSQLFAITHVISVENDEFDPAIMTVNVGDTLAWMWDEGMHTTTSTYIPAGATAWDQAIDQNNLMFIYIVTVPGSYDYQCSYHAQMGMLGHFIALGSTDIEENPKPQLPINTIVTDFITINQEYSGYSYELSSRTGEVVRQGIDYNSNHMIEVTDLKSGIYFLYLTDGIKRHSYKIIKL